MKKKCLSFNYIILALFCQIAILSQPASAITESQSRIISENCTNIHQTLETLQKIDSRTRTYLGSYYERILSKYMIPLNAALAKNSIFNSDLADNQVRFKDAKNDFAAQFTNYQRALEELVHYDCYTDPSGFYSRLSPLRAARERVRVGTITLNNLIVEHRTLVKNLEETL